MPGSGYNSKNMKLARRMLEYCRFSYKAYAQTCLYPLDPFFESHGAGIYQGARDRLMKEVHKTLGSEADAAKFDPVQYKLTTTPNPHHGVVYRGGAGSDANQYILFQPRPLDRSITYARGYNLQGTAVDAGPTLTNAQGSARCCYFQGKTGMTQNHPLAGWQSWLGAVIYDPESTNCVIVFRGSRSGVGSRALLQAQFKSIGSPDWVTDMNHLKGVEVQKYDRATLSCGFHYAFESCKTSLKAAYRDAVGSARPKAIYVTGHSLGGALATCCYLDLTCGDLAREIIMARQEATEFPIVCFPISAPPVVLGRVAHQKLSLGCDATQIHHYFCPKDCVHASSLVEFGAAKFGNAFISTFSHPLTDPYHLGTEIEVPSAAAFPDAHEPEEVWKGMNGGTSDSAFWPRFQLENLAENAPFVKNLPQGLGNECKAALRESVTSAGATARAFQWKSVVKDDDRADGFAAELATFQRAGQIVQDLKNATGGPVSSGMRNTLAQLRKKLIEQYKGASGHKASSSCYWTVLQSLTVDQVLLDGLA